MNYHTVGSTNIDEIILKIIVKPLVTRLNQMEKELIHPKNTTLYTDCRTFFSFIKPNFIREHFIR